jgi:VPDSG-CTERM motif
MDWSFTTQSSGGRTRTAFSFSANGVVVPDGGSAVALLGLALVGVEVLRRKVLTSSLCVLLQMSVNVQVNMGQLGNDQSQSEREQSKPRGRFTGERLISDTLLFR